MTDKLQVDPRRHEHIAPIACQRCGCGMVCAVRLDGLILLHAPPFLVEKGRCRCSVCGTVLHWDAHKRTVKDALAMSANSLDRLE